MNTCKPFLRAPFLWLALVAAVLFAGAAAPQSSIQRAPNPRLLPRPEPVAETRLLMEGLNDANFKGLQRILTQKPDSSEAWAFARGQALLIAETANLLMLRPPRTEGRSAWLDRAGELRSNATRLARAAGARDYEQSRANLAAVAGTCNRCHQTFRISVRVAPFTGRADEPATAPVP